MRTVREEVEATLGFRVSDETWDLVLEAELDETLPPEGIARLLGSDRIKFTDQRARFEDVTAGLAESSIERGRLLGKVYGRMAETDRSVIELRQSIERKPSSDDFAAWVRRRLRDDRKRADDRAGVTNFVYTDDDGEPVTMEVPADGVLAAVSAVASGLAKRFPWAEHKIPRWLIAGSPVPRAVQATVKWNLRPAQLPPELEELRRFFEATSRTRPYVRTDTMTRLTLTVDPALSPGEVAAIFARARRSIYSGERIRPMTARAAALAGFVLDRPESLEEAPWEDWRRQWNKVHPDWAYERAGAKQNFIRAARSALDRLTHVGWGGIEVSAGTLREENT